MHLLVVQSKDSKCFWKPNKGLDFKFWHLIFIFSSFVDEAREQNSISFFRWWARGHILQCKTSLLAELDSGLSDYKWTWSRRLKLCRKVDLPCRKWEALCRD